MGVLLAWGWSSVLVSLSWYCDWAAGEAVEAEPEEADGDDILFCCREDGWQGTVRSLKTVDGAYNAC